MATHGSPGPSYTPEQFRDDKRANKYVQVWLVIAVLTFFFFAITANVLSNSLRYLRRKYAAKWNGKSRPSAACSRTGKACTRWLAGTTVAALRKFSMRKSKIAELVGMRSLGEVLVISGYWTLNIILVVTGATGNIDYMAHHAARLFFANLPLVVGLASKNNTISFLTGISYESLNVFHRWVARLLLLLAVIHVAGRTYVNNPSTNPNIAGGGYIRWGIAAFILFSYMILAAARPLRNKWYQFFIISHVTCFIFGTIALAVHRPSVAPWLYAGLIIYFLDRILRTMRIILHHTVNRIKPAQVQGPVGKVEALSKALLRVTVHTSLTWIPGQHVYLHVPFISAGGHPFSVSSIDKPLTQTTDERPDHSTVVLLVRVREGVTRRLYDLAYKSPDGKLSATLPTVWVEGPYGNLSHLDYYQTVLLVSGGSGVSFTLPVMLDIVRRKRSMALGNGEIAVATERLTFVWIVRNEEDTSWIADVLQDAIQLAPPGFLRVLVYVTGKKPVTVPSSLTSPTSTLVPVEVPSSKQDDETIELKPLSHRKEVTQEGSVKIINGRPSFSSILENEIEATDYSDYMAVGTCGPGPMTADLANAVSNAMELPKVLRGEHRRNIRLHCEEFGW